MSSNTAPTDDEYIVYVPYHSTASTLPIRVRKDACVDHLKEAIRDHKDLKSHVGKEKLYLFKYSKPFEGTPADFFEIVKSWLHSNDTKEQMVSGVLLNEYFPNGSSPENRQVDVVIATDSFMESRDVVRDTLSGLPAIDRRDETLSTFKEIMSVGNVDGVQMAHERLFTGRLDDRYGHPVALFHPELALLQQRLQMLDAQVKTGQDWADPRTTRGQPGERTELTADIFDIAWTYFNKSRAWYESEGLRWSATRAFFEWIFGTNDMVMQKRSEPNGVNRTVAVWGEYGIVVAKNQLGLAGDASLQSAVWYGKRCNSMKKVFKYSKFPVILIGVVANVLEVSIAVCLEEVVVDKILYLEVLYSPHYDETVAKLALVASALKTCAGKLRAEYHDLKQTSASERVEEETWHLPCPSAAAPSPNSSIPALKFTAKLSRSNRKLTKLEGENFEMRPLFLAMYHDQEVIVKFSVSYNIAAHHALAEQKYAPKLHACERVIGRLEMVVMERVDGKRMFDEREHSLPRSVFEDLEKALKIIHDKGLVFGNLRDTNVMITKSDVRVEAKLVDFDWADKDEKGRYPALMNVDLIGAELAPDILPFGSMYKKHDEYALSKLISKYCDDAAYRETKCKELMESGGY